MPDSWKSAARCCVATAIHHDQVKGHVRVEGQGQVEGCEAGFRSIPIARVTRVIEIDLDHAQGHARGWLHEQAHLTDLLW